jgi:hypothetical protein
MLQWPAQVSSVTSASSIWSWELPGLCSDAPPLFSSLELETGRPLEGKIWWQTVLRRWLIFIKNKFSVMLVKLRHRKLEEDSWCKAKNDTQSCLLSPACSPYSHCPAPDFKDLHMALMLMIKIYKEQFNCDTNIFHILTQDHTYWYLFWLLHNTAQLIPLCARIKPLKCKHFLYLKMLPGTVSQHFKIIYLRFLVTKSCKKKSTGFLFILKKICAEWIQNFWIINLLCNELDRWVLRG